MDVTSLAGGTEAIGVPSSVFDMPEGSVIRYDRSSAQIAEFITGYHLYAAHGPSSINKVDWFLPGTANIRITLNAGPIAVRIRREFSPLPPVALFGPTSQAMRAVTNGGIMVGIGICALGWARLFKQPASAYHDAIVPLERLTGPTLPCMLSEALAAAPDEHAVKPILDAVLAPSLTTPNPDEPVIRALSGLLIDPEAHQVSIIAERLGLPGHSLSRITSQYFGMSAKPLLRRARFLRSMTRMMRQPAGQYIRDIDPSYYDASHFLRDAEYFLGMTPRRFMALSTPFLDASIRARAAVLGAPTQALHDPATAPANAGL